MKFEMLTSRYAVAPQIDPHDVSALAEHGFVHIICNRPDGEESGQPIALDIDAACRKVGIGFDYIPVTAAPFARSDIESHRQIIVASPGPVLAYCRTGRRSRAIFEAGESSYADES